MNLKERLNAIVKDSERQRAEKEREWEYPNPVRTDEDWKLIEEYLTNCLTEFAATTEIVTVKFTKKFGGEIKKKYICIDCLSGSMLFPRNEQGNIILLSSEESLEICNEDMKRFCKEQKLNLEYLIYKTNKREYWEYEFSRDYKGRSKTRSYLVEV